MGNVRIGCSGWNYKDWRESFYPKGVPVRAWLEYYATRFDTVEVNSTFYRLPKKDSVAHWVEQTPPGFLFAVKASRYLTHLKRLKDIGTGLKNFYEPLSPLIEANKLGPVLWQLPANFHRDDERLGAALRQLPRGRHCFEFRHESWFCDEIYQLLHDHQAALVIGDTPQRPFQTHELTADFVLVRFHYGSRGRHGNYGPTELQRWAKRLRAWRRGHDVFAYFNNDWSGYAPRNAAHLARALKAKAEPARARSRARKGRPRP